MGLFDEREAEVNLELTVDTKRAYEALLGAFAQAGLKVTSQDESQLTATAKSSTLRSIFSNGYGEVVTFRITQHTPDHCAMTIRSVGKSFFGGYSHGTHFRNIREYLQQELGDEAVRGAVQPGAAYSARTREVAQSERLAGEVRRAVGANGAVVVFADKISVLRLAGALNGLLHGMKGDKEIRLSKLTSIQLRKPSALTRGYIQFEAMGCQTSQNGIWDATQDENTVLFDIPDLDSFIQVKEHIDSLIGQKEAAMETSVPTKLSAASELKEWKDLLDAGAISPEEYDAKKAELLART